MQEAKRRGHACGREHKAGTALFLDTPPLPPALCFDVENLAALAQRVAAVIADHSDWQSVQHWVRRNGAHELMTARRNSAE